MGVTPVTVAVLSAGCASPQDKVNDACVEVRDVVNDLPEISGSDTFKEIVPIIDKELAAARKAQSEFDDTDVAHAFRSAWAAMITAMQEKREEWQKDAEPSSRRGLVGALELAEKGEEVDKAKSALNAAAAKSGYVNCGASVKWQY